MVETVRNVRSIEEVPDDILVDILSRLQTKEAAATCLVSRRWRNKWTLCRNLHLDFTNDKYNADYVRKSLHYVLKKFQQQQTTINHMRIAFHDDYRGFDHQTFQELMFEYSYGERVQSLNIDVKTVATNAATIPPRRRCFPPSNSWDRLTALSLKSVILDDSDVDILLSNSPNLETLVLNNVPVTKLVVKNTNTKLKRFEIWYCVSFRSINIFSGPSLESFVHVPGYDKYYVGDSLIEINTNINVYSQQVPNLGAIYLGGPLCRNLLWELQNCAPQLQKLQLDMDVKCEDYHMSELQCWGLTIPKLENLKQLELRFTCIPLCGSYVKVLTYQMIHRSFDSQQMDTVIELIHSCPCLEKLTLKYENKKDCVGYDYGTDVDDYDLKRGANECLREVQVVGWSGLKSEVRFIRYLIHTSPNLQDLVLDPTPPHQTEASWQFYPISKTEKDLESAALVAEELIGYQHMHSN